ncbi:MAG: AAA family ATPase [Thiofilum sp.]
MVGMLKRLGVMWVVFWVCLLPVLGSQTKGESQQSTIRIESGIGMTRADVLKQLLEDDFITYDTVALFESNRLIIGLNDGTIQIWDMEHETLEHTLATQSSVLSLALDKSGQLVSGSADGAIQIWDIKRGLLKRKLVAQGGVLSLALDKNGRLVSGSTDGTIQIWDIEKNSLINTLKTQQMWLKTIVFDGGNKIAIGSIDGIIQIWDIEKNSLINTLKVEKNWLKSLAFNKRGELASGSIDGTIQIWDIDSGQVRHTLKSSSSILSLSFDDAGRMLILASNGAIQVLNVMNNNIQLVFKKPDVDILGFEVEKNNSNSGLLKNEDYLESMIVKLEGDPSIFYTGTNNLNITLTNHSEKPIYKPQLVETFSEDSLFHVIPNDQKPLLFEERYNSPSIIEVGQSAKISGSVLVNTPKFVATGKYELPIKIQDFSGHTKLVKFKVDYKSLDIEIKSAFLENNFFTRKGVLTVKIANLRMVELDMFDFYLQTPSGALSSTIKIIEVGQSSDAQTTENIKFETDEIFSKKQLDNLKLELRIRNFINMGRYGSLHFYGKDADLRSYVSTLYTEWYFDIKVNVSYWLLISQISGVIVLIVSIYWLFLFINPISTALSRRPVELITIPFDQLTKTKNLLRWSGRFRRVLDDAEVSTQTFSQALDFAQLTPEQKAQIIAKRLGAKLERVETPPNLPLSREEQETQNQTNSEIPSSLPPSLDKGRDGEGFSLFTLKLPDNFILNVNRLLLYFPTVSTEDVFTTLRAIPQAEGRITLIINTDAAYQRKLLNTTQDRSNKYVAPQSKQLTALLLSPKPEAVLAKVLAEQLALQQLSPYQIGGGVNKEAIFFGRRELIAQIINRDPANYLIVGGRQMGKSSLLKALERRYAENPQVHCCYLSLSNEVLIPRLAHALNLDSDTAPDFAAQLEVRIKNEGKRYIFLIDEADLFIEHEQAQGYPMLSVFRRLSEQGQCSFILAGFWQLYQHAVLDYQSPLRNFGAVLEVGALEQEACEQLATIPMQTLNLSYANPQIMQHMISQCGQRANLIAHVCDQLIQQLQPSQRIIEVGDVHPVLTGRDLQKRLEGWSVGIGEHEQAYDRLVVYTTVQHDSFTTGELIQTLEQQSVQFESAELERTLSRLELAFVLRRLDKRWAYCVPLFVELMREDDLTIKREREWRRWQT